MKSARTSILTVSKNTELKSRIEKLFPKNRFAVLWESEIDQILQRFKSDTYGVVILTSSACKDGEPDCIRFLDVINSKSPSTQVLLLVEPDDIQLAISALRVGSYQYAKLPISDEELKLLIETALERRPQYGANLLLKDNQHEDRFEKLLGRSLPMQQVYGQIRQAAATEIPVLLLGETGTGKDLAAQAIHRRSARKEGPYIPVNLGALPTELVASELFGHEKGAFTGALKQHKGKFEQGKGGTVFLDEIDAIDEKVQISLLRLIEQKRFHRLGGERAIKSNVRLIVASNQNIEELVRVGSFREDLFYRLDVFRIVMPPLKKRDGDIPLLVEKFLTRYTQSFNKNILGIAPDCIQLLEAYDWPGNVRELKNVIQRAVLVCDSEEIFPEHLPRKFRTGSSGRPKVTFEVGTPLDEVERKMIIRALAEAKDNRKRAAELLGISRRAIYNKLRKHNIQ